MKSCLPSLLVAVLISYSSDLILQAADLSEKKDDPSGNAFFESKIRPVLVKHCYECHSVESGKSKGGLRLDSKQGIRAGGEIGPAIVPSDAAKSLLLTAIKHTDPDLEMPPKKPQLAKSIIADIETWIKMGAPDPREISGKTVERAPVDIEAGRKFWSYQKPVPHPLPATKNPAWAKRELDQFILAKLEKSGLQPSPDADVSTLLRRLHLDIIGLPPTQEAVMAFEKRIKADGLDAALAIEVDALLKSERFGERWGKHWMDVVRYAESTGKESNLTFPQAWRYRDYVIDSLNADKPYNRFLTEQIAGDLLPAKDDAERANLLIATSFLALGTKGLNEMNPAQFNADLADEQLDTVTRAVMASSVACARCHDHKFDPFSVEDYYGLIGVFTSTKTFFGSSIGSESSIASDFIHLPELPGQLIPNKPVPADQLAKMRGQLAEMSEQEKKGKVAADKAVKEGRNPFEVFSLGEILRIYWTRGGIEGQLKTVDDQGRALPLCMGVQEGTIQDAPIFVRGEVAHPGKTVARRFPRVIELEGVDAPPKEQSGRLQFAQWLTHREQPFTARVMVNRVWRHLFGEGLVATVDNFGFTGERPSHPELLDYLALKFVGSEWSLKSIIREVVLSRSYRQSSTYREECFTKDPDNRLLWRANKRRLDAEVIRDSMLFVSGQLDTTRRPGSLVAGLGERSVSLFGFAKEVPIDLDGCHYRSVYLPVIRDRMPDILELFDAAEPSLVSGDRDVTNVPLQALYLMNSPFMQERSVALAERVMREATGTEERIHHAFALCFNRQPDAKEFAMAQSYFKAAPKSSAPTDEQMIFTSYCQSLLSTAEFRNMD